MSSAGQAPDPTTPTQKPLWRSRSAEYCASPSESCRVRVLSRILLLTLVACGPSVSGQIDADIDLVDALSQVDTNDARPLPENTAVYAHTSNELFRIDPDSARIAGRFRFSAFNALYIGILLPSALWMPLTFAMLERPSGALWWAIRLVLALVGLASLGLLAALLALYPRGPARAPLRTR